MRPIGTSSDFRWMAAPAVIFAAAMIAFPIGYAVWLALSDVTLGSEPRFAGFANFARLFADQVLLFPRERSSDSDEVHVTALTPQSAAATQQHIETLARHHAADVQHLDCVLGRPH